jgi:penicillin-binding protein 1C
MPDHSPEFLEWMISEKIPFDKAPPHLKSCSVVQGQDRLVIISPVQGKEYLLEQGNTDGISFRCLAPDDSEKLFWYLNGKFVGSALPGEQVFFTPATGKNSVSCTDDKGRSVKAEFSFGWY